MATKKRKIITGLDIGTTKVCAIIGEPDPQTNEMKILGLGSTPSKGLKRGIVIDIDDTVETIREAINRAEEQAEVTIKDVFIGLAGEHITSHNTNGVVEITNSLHGVTRTHVLRAIEKAKQLTTPFDREIIHCIPQDFICDDQPGIRNPLGMSCSRLEARMHIVTAAITAAQNLIQCVEQSGFKVKGFLLQSLASSLAILNEEEQEMGVLLIDIGGGTTDVALFQDNAVRYSSAIPFAGDNITSDLKIGLRIPSYDAENLKKKYGCAMAAAVDPDEKVEVQLKLKNESSEISRRFVAEIIQSRLEEVFLLVRERMEKRNMLDNAVSGVVLTGGSALLEDIVPLAEKIFERPVRVGAPRGLRGISSAVASPIYATGIGLVYYGNSNAQFPRPKPRNLFTWLRDIFRKFIDWDAFEHDWSPE